MSDKTALLRAVLERPEDDIPRLVMADWLEENAGTVPCEECGGKGFNANEECEVCGNRPDEGGYIEHGRGCYTQDPDGGGSSFAECRKCDGSGSVSNGNVAHAQFIRDCVWMHANHTDCPVRLGGLERGRPVPLRCGSCEYCTARRRAEKFYAKHIWLPGVNYAVCFEPSPLDGPMPTGPGLTLTVSRGFISSVHTTLQSWVGGPCPCVNGHDYDSNGERTIPWCKTCSGTARTPGHGPRIVAEQPVERVELTDVGHPEAGFSLTHESHSHMAGGGVVVPADVFKWLPRPKSHDVTKLRGEWPADYWAGTYESKIEMDTALSLALVNWARREAGLPPLEILTPKFA